MKTLIALTTFALLALAALAFQTAQTAPPTYDQLKAQAEKHYEEQSFSLAHELYLQGVKLETTPIEKRWLNFRLADTLWRSQASTQTSDTSRFDQAREDLERLIGEIRRPEERDRVWAEAQQSLGDFWWTRRNNVNWGQAWPHYQQALDWWASSAELDLAGRRYLQMIWTMSRPAHAEPYYYYGYYGNVLPLEVVENGLKIAQSSNDKAHLHYLIAMTLRHTGDWEQRQRVPEEFEAALQIGKTSDGHDDALYHYAEWMAQQGRIIPLADGQWQQQADYVKALELFRRLVREYAKGETRYYDQAQAQITTITSPVVQVVVPGVFLPDSEMQYHLSWRNGSAINFTLTRVDLTSDVHFSEKETHSGAWLQAVTLGPNARVKSWTKAINDKGDYKPGQETLRYDGKLPAGAYVLEARNGTVRSRELILVSDSTVVLKASAKQALVYFCNAITGAPIPEARVKLWEGTYSGQKWVWRELSKDTGKDGIAVFGLNKSNSNVQIFAAAVVNERQAFSLGQPYWYSPEAQPWRIYAFTDRPAYRPKEQVQWKFVARRLNDSVYATPAQQTIEFEITDPRSAKVKEGKAVLNSFGSTWGSLELTEAMPLGEYTATFWDAGRRNHIGSATLFRLEEYKLPEFKVSIQTPEANGRKKIFQLGDKVEVNIQADYYFGGAVSNASVEVIVHQNPFHHYWEPPFEYPWFYTDMSLGRNHWGGSGTVLKRETLKTDATGKASLTFETPRDSQQDFEYRIEARVTDASRREIVGTDTVRVTRQPYYVYPRAKHNLYRPQDKVAIDIKALDANHRPVQAEGRVKVTRDSWYEVWVSPEDRDVQGEELKLLREQNRIFPPPTPSGAKPWRLKLQGYQHDDVLELLVKTDAEGDAEFTFTPEHEGYYRVVWTGTAGSEALRRVPQPIRAETTVWVARNNTTELGYRYGGLEIILDKETFQAGRTAPILLSVPSADRYVLFATEADDLYSYQLVHVIGTAKLLELEIQEKHIPNLFLSAAMVSDRQFFMDTKQVVVPPVKNFLKVEVKPDRSQYQPRDEGTLIVTSSDQEGKPVAAELALGLVDESVYYIQQEYAGDPRQFYYGTKRLHAIQTQSTLNLKAYSKLVDNGLGALVDDRDLAKEKEAARSDLAGGRFRHGDEFGGKGGGLGGVVAGAPMSVSQVREEKSLSSNRAYAQNAKETDQVARKVALMADTPQEPAVQVRSDFRSTAFWQPDVVTGTDGRAVVKLKYPDSVTTWKAIARAASAGNQFGIGSETTRTQQPLIVRLQAPRFFVVGDRVTVSAIINNNTDQPMTVTPSLSAEGLLLQPSLPGKAGKEGVKGRSAESGRPLLKSAVSNGEQASTDSASSTLSALQVKPHGEARVDWITVVEKPGNAKLKVTARGGKFADAMEKDFIVHEHGIEKFISKAGKLRGNEVTIKLDLPRERRTESTVLKVQITSSLAVTMLDALPYLIDYPYGCTEQTMSRFLPAAITMKTLKALGVKPETVMNRLFGGIVAEHAGQTHPKGRKDLGELDDMVKLGLERLYGFQHSDGGWGWWKDGESDHFMSAYVVWGLTLAREAGIAVRSDVVDRGVSFLDKELVEEEQHPDLQTWMLHALSAHHAASKAPAVGKFQAKAFDNLWSSRQSLNAYTRALLALSAHQLGNGERARTLVQNLENGVKRDSRPDSSILQGGAEANESVMGTAHWGEDGIYWRWSDGGVEATAFALRALLEIDPKNPLVEPVTNWMIRNRRGAQWSNTRDTAITVLALNDYLRQSGELAADAAYELRVNGQTVATKIVAASEVLAAPSQFEIDRKLLRDGANDIRILRKGGKGPLYFAAQAQFFSLEEPVSSAGNEIFVRRDYYRLTHHPTLLKGFVTVKELFKEGDKLVSGDRVEVVLTVEAKNNYEYLVFEDLKPAGLEAVQIRSGEPLYANELKSAALKRLAQSGTQRAEANVSDRATTFNERTGGLISRSSPLAGGSTGNIAAASDFTGRSRWVYQELRDRKVALFIDKLPEGMWEIRYELRAEVPGEFHALPVLGHAMYVPEIRCNGTEQRVRVVDVEREEKLKYSSKQ